MLTQKFNSNYCLKGNDMDPLQTEPDRHDIGITGAQGFWISKKFGHPTSGSGGKKKFEWYLKMNTPTDTHTHIWTNRLIESIGPEGRCFENIIVSLVVSSCLTKRNGDFWSKRAFLNFPNILTFNLTPRKFQIKINM